LLTHILFAIALSGYPIHGQGKTPTPSPPTKVNAGDEVLDEYGTTRLMMANLREAEMLLNRGAKVDLRDKGGRTALMRAAYGQAYHHALLFLSRGAKADAVDNEGRTPLLNCVFRTRELGLYNGELVNLLLRKKTPINTQDKDGNTALHLMLSCDLLATCVGEPPMVNMPLEQLVELLLSRGADPGIKNKAGQTPLSLATKEHKLLSQLAESAATRTYMSERYSRIADRLRLAGAKE